MDSIVPTSKLQAKSSVLDVPIPVTFFVDKKAQTKREESVSLRQLAALVERTHAPTKQETPLFKLCRFGSLRSDRNSLRHAANMGDVQGVELDYDGKKMQPDEAVRLLQEAGVAAVVYTSASHTPEEPRWRVLAPLAAPYPEGQRNRFAGVLNTLIGGVAAGESFYRSQGFHYGYVTGCTTHRVLLVEGRFLDDVLGVDPTIPPRGGAGQKLIELPARGQDVPEDEYALQALAHICTTAGDTEPDNHTVVKVATWNAAKFVKSRHLDAATVIDAVRAVLTREPNPNEIEAALSGAVGKVEPHFESSNGVEFATDPVPAEQPVPAVGEGEHPTIHVLAHNHREQVERAEAALIRAGLPLFQRAGQLVSVGPVKGVVKSQPVGRAHLRLLMGGAATWKRFAKGEEVDTGVPWDVPDAYIDLGELHWHLPHLAGITRTPTLRSDGSALTAPGYDVATGLWLDTGDCPAICPDQPTKQDAAAALKQLDAVLAEFPFVGPVDRSAALAAILTAVVRQSLPTAPMFCFDAPTYGTGKSLLLNVVAMIGTGAVASGFTWSATGEAENEKRLDAALIEGRATITLDNVTAPVGGARLNQMLTEDRVTVRVLGQSTTRDCSCRVFVMCNGNNLVVEADTVRRAVTCRMDARVERPEERQFAIPDLLAHVQANRAALVGAALTVLRAHHLAGRPGDHKPLGSFTAWSAWVRGALLWLGCDDPVASQAAARAIDPKRNGLVAVLGHWNERLGDREVTVAEIIAEATIGAEFDTITPGAVNRATRAEFREVLLEVAGKNGAIDTKRLGQWLRQATDQIADGMCIQSAGKNRNKVGVWRLRGGANRLAGVALSHDPQLADFML